MLNRVLLESNTILVTLVASSTGSSYLQMGQGKVASDLYLRENSLICWVLKWWWNTKYDNYAITAKSKSIFCRNAHVNVVIHRKVLENNNFTRLNFGLIIVKKNKISLTQNLGTQPVTNVIRIFCGRICNVTYTL